MSMPKSLIILADLQDQDLIWLARTGELRDLANNQTLIDEGTEIRELFFVIDGRFSVATDGEEIAQLGVGDVLGEMSFVERRPTSATVTAQGAGRVLAVQCSELQEEFGRNVGFAARFYRALAVFLSDRLRSMAGRADNHELEDGLLDTLHVAGDRTLRLISLLEGGSQSA